MRRNNPAFSGPLFSQRPLETPRRTLATPKFTSTSQKIPQKLNSIFEKYKNKINKIYEGSEFSVQ